MKNIARRVIGVVLILCGVGMLGWIGYGKYTIYIEQQKLKKAFNEVLENSYNDQNIDVGTSEAVVKDKDSNVAENKTSEKKIVNPLGLVKIPKIDIESAMVDGVDVESLRYAVGHFPETAKAGQKGNFALAAHNYSFFSKINKLIKGDLIIIKTKDKEFTYVVDDSFIVKPEDIGVLKATDDATITLVTCTPGAKERYIIKGKLKS